MEWKNRLPVQIVEHVDVLTDPFFCDFVPHLSGATQNAFFANNPPAKITPSCESRTVACPMPYCLRTVYAKYPRDVEFVARGWTFLSEDEIETRAAAFCEAGQLRCVDMAVRYAGMGHVHVLTYDLQSQMVFVQLDGGSNQYDRVANHDARLATDIDEIDKEPFAVWWGRLE